MSERLVVTLDAIGEDLLGYLDEDEELAVPAVASMVSTIDALLGGETTPCAVQESWPAWYGLSVALTDAYGLEWLDDLWEEAPMVEGLADEVVDADRAYLKYLRVALSEYLEARRAGRPFEATWP